MTRPLTRALPPVPPGRHSEPEPRVVYVERFNWPPFLSRWWFWLMIMLMVVTACGPRPQTEYHSSPGVDSSVTTTQTGGAP